MTVPAYGTYMIYSVLAAAAVSLELGLSDAEIARGLARYETVGRRSRVVKTGYCTLVDDCYNANPQAMAEALRLLARTACASRVAVLGDMGELGELTVPAHEDMGRLCRELGLDRVIAIGPKAASIARTLLYHRGRAPRSARGVRPRRGRARQGQPRDGIRQNCKGTGNTLI